jgi:hypothetical protein
VSSDLSISQKFVEIYIFLTSQKTDFPEKWFIKTIISYKSFSFGKTVTGNFITTLVAGELD